MIELTSMSSLTPRTTTPEGIDPRTERVRAAVLEAAFALLMEEGPGAVTHVQVAAAARVSRTTVYKHFPTRAELLRTTIETYEQPIRTQVTGDLRTDLRALLGHLFEDLADDRRSCAFAAMLERALHDDVVAQVRNDIVEQGARTFATIISNGIARGEVRSDVDLEFAMGTLVGPVLLRRYLRGDALRTDELDGFLERFIETIAPR